MQFDIFQVQASNEVLLKLLFSRQCHFPCPLQSVSGTEGAESQGSPLHIPAILPAR
jgi:hypothetical protein